MTKPEANDAELGKEDVELAADLVAYMTDQQRLDLFANYCTHCGCNDPKCQCWNDE